MWNAVKDLLIVGGKGIRILSTTRSRLCAEILGDKGLVYELKGLSEEASWQLFQSVAFGLEIKDPQFVEIGGTIAVACSNSPLVLKVAGSFLYGQPLFRWLDLHSTSLP